MDGQEEQHGSEAHYNDAKIQFISLLNIWKETRVVSIKEMRKVADALAKLEKDVTISQTAGTTTSLIGGIVALAGFIAAPFTFGASALIAGVVGAGIGIAGGLVTAGSSLSKIFIKNTKLKTSETAITFDTKMLGQLLDSLMKLNEACVALTNFDKQDQRAYSFRKAYRNLCRHIGVRPGSDGHFAESLIRVLIGVVIVPAETTDAVQAGVGVTRTAEMGTKAGLVGVDLGASMVRTASMTVGRVVLSGVLTSVGIVIDVAFLAYLGRKLHKGSPSQVAKELRERADMFEKQLLKFDEFAKRFTGPPSYLERLYLQARRKISKINLRSVVLCFAVLLVGTWALVMWLSSGPVQMTAIGFPRPAERVRLELSMGHVVQKQSSFAWHLVHFILGFVFTLGTVAVLLLC